MIEFRLKELMAVRGFKSIYPTLRRIGIHQGVAQRYIQGKAHRIKFKHIEKLCGLLRCEPNDLFSWTPDQPADDFPENMLQVIRKKELPPLKDEISKLTLSEVLRIRKSEPPPPQQPLASQ